MRQECHLSRMAAVYRCLAAGADANRLVEGWAPLHWAVQIPDAEEACEVIRVLLKHGRADVNIRRGYFSCTPLHALALHNPSAEAAVAAARALLAAGADAKAADRYGVTVLHCAANNRSAAAVAALVPLLAEAGADVGAKGSAVGRTALHCAAANPDAAAAAAGVQALLAAGADVNAADEDGCTPLHRAACNPNPAAAAAAARALLAGGANPRFCDSDGVPPLVAAMQRKDAGACGELLQVLAEAVSDGGGRAAGPSNAGAAGPSNASAAGARGGAAADPSRLLNLAAAGVRRLLKRKAPDGSAPSPGECVVCLDARAAMAFTGCGHMVTCEACAPRVGAACPVCGQPKGAAIKVFM